MKFVKGMFIGGLVTTGIMMMYLENENKAKRKMIKKGKQFNLELKKQNLLRKYNFEHVKTCSFCLLKPKCNKDLIRWKKT